MDVSSASEKRALTVQLLEWLDATPRTHADVMETWQTACPRLSIWEDAVAEGLVGYAGPAVVVKAGGRALLGALQQTVAKSPRR
jgi:hypothetical protein